MKIKNILLKVLLILPFITAYPMYSLHLRFPQIDTFLIDNSQVIELNHSHPFSCLLMYLFVLLLLFVEKISKKTQIDVIKYLSPAIILIQMHAVFVIGLILLIVFCFLLYRFTKLDFSSN